MRTSLAGVILVSKDPWLKAFESGALSRTD